MFQFAESLISEESVFIMPGSCFNIPSHFRIVLTIPEDLMAEACDRIAQFCDRHMKTPKGNMDIMDEQSTVTFQDS